MVGESSLLTYYLVGFGFGAIAGICVCRINALANRKYGMAPATRQACGVSLGGSLAPGGCLEVCCGRCEGRFLYRVASAAGEALVQCPHYQEIGRVHWDRQQEVLG